MIKPVIAVWPWVRIRHACVSARSKNTLRGTDFFNQIVIGQRPTADTHGSDQHIRARGRRRYCRSSNDENNGSDTDAVPLSTQTIFSISCFHIRFVLRHLRGRRRALHFNFHSGKRVGLRDVFARIRGCRIADLNIAQDDPFAGKRRHDRE